MGDHARTVDALETEIASLRARLADIERLEAERERSERALRESEQRYRLLAESAQDMIFIIGRDGLVQYVNRYAAAHLHLRPEEIVGRPREELFPPDIAARQAVSLEKVFQYGESVSIESTIRFEDRQLWIHTSLVPLREDTGEVTAVLGIARDITEMKEAARALRDNEQRYRSFVQHLEGIAFRSGFDWRPVFFHGAVERITGYTEKEFVDGSVTWAQMIHPEDRAAKNFHSTELVATPGHAYEMDYRIVRRDGEIRWVHQAVRNGCDDSGKPAYVEGVVYDITDRKQVEEELRRARKEWQEIFQAIGHPVLILDAEHRILAANRAAFVGACQSEKSIMHRKCFDVVHCRTDGPPARCPVETLLKSGRAETVEMQMEAFGGTYLISCTPVLDDSGALVRIIHIATDITEHKRAEEERQKLEAQLRQAQKMEAVGRLAGGVAHDFNNLLTVITGNVDLATAVAGDGSPKALAEALEHIAGAAQRGAALTRQLLMFSRKELPRPQVLNLNSVVQGMEPMLRRLIGEQIEFNVDLCRELDLVLADKPQMEQVLMNLALNARDAMQHGGKLTIRTGNVLLDERYADEHVEAHAGEHVMLSVADVGGGMDAATLEHIFEPFFTTKPLDKGAGLGLAIVYGIIRQAGGHVKVDSRVGEGTVFEVYMPAVKVADGPHPAPLGKGLPEGHETVLLCEDEEGVRYIARTALRRAGYTVIEAASGRQALELVAAHPGTIDLLVTDMVMPQMTGRELATTLRLTHPGLGVVLMSGYSSGLIDDKTLKAEQLDFLPKPFQLVELLHLVRTVLDRTASK